MSNIGKELREAGLRAAMSLELFAVALMKGLERRDGKR